MSLTGLAPSLSMSPQSKTCTGMRGCSYMSVGTRPIARITSIPETTCPNTTCLPSRCGAGFRVTKNYEEFVSRPEFAMERSPACACLRVKFSSGKVLVP